MSILNPANVGRLILASTSEFRQAQLRQLGIEFEVIAPEVDEDQWKDRGLNPKRLALELAQAKARDVFRRFSDARVIGADQVAICEGRILNKPETFEKAVEQLTLMQAKKHKLLSGIAWCAPGREDVRVVVMEMKMKPLSKEQIIAYVTKDQPLQSAGSYKFERGGAALFERVSGDDPTSIIGLPLMTVSEWLGWPLP